VDSFLPASQRELPVSLIIDLFVVEVVETTVNFLNGFCEQTSGQLIAAGCLKSGWNYAVTHARAVSGEEQPSKDENPQGIVARVFCARFRCKLKDGQGILA